MRYHERFTRIKPFVVQRLQCSLRGWNEKSESERWSALDGWAVMVVNDPRGYRGMRRPKVVIDPLADAGFYLPFNNEIHMAHPSLITYLHEFRHAMQAQGFAGSWRDAEEDARGWSLSLYNAAAPRTLRRLVEAGRVFHMTAADMEMR